MLQNLFNYTVIPGTTEFIIATVAVSVFFVAVIAVCGYLFAENK